MFGLCNWITNFFSFKIIIFLWIFLYLGVKEILSKKYHFAVLNKIHEEIEEKTFTQQYNNIIQLNRKVLSKTEQTKYLKRSSPNDINSQFSKISHESLGTFEQYLNESTDLKQRKELIEYIKKNIQNRDHTIFKLSVMLFILETGKQISYENYD